jgi:hypothetical protein
VSTESETYWQTGAQDAAIQGQHGFIWRGMLDTIDADLGGKRSSTPAATGEGSCVCRAANAGSSTVAHPVGSGPCWSLT